MIDQTETPQPSPGKPQGKGKREPPAGRPDPLWQKAKFASNALRRDRDQAHGGQADRELETMGGAEAVVAVGLDSMKDRGGYQAQEIRRALIHEMLLSELPGLDIQRFDQRDARLIKPDGRQIEQCQERYAKRLGRLGKDLAQLESDKGNPKLIDELRAEIEHCEACLDVLGSALRKTPSKKQEGQETSSFWRNHLLDRWNERYPTVNLLDRLRALRDVDDVLAEQPEDGQPEFVFLPQELCWLEMEIAVAELLEIHRSSPLTADRFVQLIRAIACGWPGVREDSQSPLPERRANAAGCLRALAQLANKGRLPREVLASFSEYDEINRALLIRGHEKEMGGKYIELGKAEKQVEELEAEIERQKPKASDGKGKERDDEEGSPELENLKLNELNLNRNRLREQIETLNSEIWQVNGEFHSVPPMQKAGRELGALYAELMVAERNLRAAGVNIRRVRIDEHFVKGMLRHEPKKRKKVALMLARVALIEEDIAKLNPHFQRHVEQSIMTYGVIGAHVNEQMAEEGVNPHKGNYKPKRHWPLPAWMRNLPVGASRTMFTEGWRIEKTRNPLALTKLRRHQDNLLSYAITDEDALEMKLPSKVEKMGDGKDLHERDKETIRNLANANLMSPSDVKLMHVTQEKIRTRLIDTTTGRRNMRSAFGMTTAQLSAEYLDLVFRWVTGRKDDFNLGYRSKEVRRAMKDRWKKLMTLQCKEVGKIMAANEKIRQKRQEILEAFAAMEGDDAPDKLGEIQAAHAICVQKIHEICETLGKQRYHFLLTMIRAAVLAARPQVLVGENPKFEAVDTYDASRYRKEIVAVLESWGMEKGDIDLFEPMIDNVVYSRGDNSDKAPGTVTARRLAAWQRYFKNGLKAANPGKPRQETFEEIASSSSLAGHRQDERYQEVEPSSRMDRAKKSAMRALKAVAGFLADKEFHDLDPEFIDKIIASIPAISNFGKISLRTNMMFHGGFPFDTGHGFAIPVTAGGGRQVGIIIKRINDRIEVRMVSGYQLDTELGIRPSWDYSGGGADVGISLEGSLWNTSGIAWHFDITYNEKTGREDFSKTQSFLRSLFTGELPSTEAVAQRISNFQRISKNGRHLRPIGYADIGGGGSEKLPETGLGIDLLATTSASLDHRIRWREGKQRNADAGAIKRITKLTNNTTIAAGGDIGLKLGFRQAVGSKVSEFGAPITKSQFLGASGGGYRTAFKNRAFYDFGLEWDKDWITNIGPVTTLKEALDKCPEDAKEKIRELLARETTLQNGNTVKFGEAIEKALKLLRDNDGFLLQWVPKPEVKRIVNRHLRRIDQITQQILPTLDPGFLRKRIAREANGAKKQRLMKQLREIEAQRQTFKNEVERLAAELRAYKDQDSVEHFDLDAIYIMPVVMQTDTTTVLNLLGLFDMSYAATRMHDTLPVVIPAPKPWTSERQRAEHTLAGRVQDGQAVQADESSEDMSEPDSSRDLVFDIRRALSPRRDLPPAPFEDSEYVESEDDAVGSSGDEWVWGTPPPARSGSSSSPGEEPVPLDSPASTPRSSPPRRTLIKFLRERGQGKGKSPRFPHGGDSPEF